MGEKGGIEDEMVGWHHQLNGHEFEETPGETEGQGSLVCCSPWGRSVRHDWVTEQQQQCVKSSLGLLKKVFAMIGVFSWQNSVSLWPALFCTPRPNLPVTPGIPWLPTFAFQSSMMKNQRNQRSKCQHLLDHWKSNRVQEKHLLLLYWICQSLWLCGSQQTVEISSRDGNNRPPYLPPEKSICRSRNNS